MTTITSEDIRSRLLVAKLPSPPQTLLKLMRLCQCEDSGIKELTDLITLDPALSAKVLAVAHSAAYHQAEATPLSLLQACSRLGTEFIKVLVMADMVTQTFNAFTPAGAIDLRSFWKHSLTVASIAKELALKLDDTAAEEAYLAGLLHDIGRLTLLAAVPLPSQALFADPDDEALCAKEQHRVGMSHTEAGAWLLRRWHLGDALAESVLRHHETAPDPVGTHALTRLIHLAHRLAALPLDQPEATTHFACDQALSAADLLSVLQSANQQVQHMARDLGLDISTTELQIQPASRVPPLPPVDPLQTQMAQTVFDRSVLNEMAMNLIGRSSNESALRHVRQYASALLQLENSVVMLLHSNQQQLRPVSMQPRHQGASKLAFDMAKDPVFARCVSTCKVVFAGRTSRCAIALLNVLDADELVLIPLISARHCMGLVAAALPTELAAHTHGQVPLLQAFGTYAGMALSRRRQATMTAQTLSAISKQEQQLGLMKMVRELGKQADPLGSVDICLAVSEVVQRLQVGRLLPGNIRIHCQLADRASFVRGSMGMIQLVTLLLISNAVERMTREGDMVISAGGLAYRNGNTFTTLTLSDASPSSSQAIDAQLSAQVTISTASDARTPGLADVSQMVEKMAGHLSFKASSTGTRFDILLPCAKHLQLAA